MELKNFQRKVLKDLSSYLNQYEHGGSLSTIWNNYWENQDIRVGFGGVPIYNDSIENTPHVCLKVPTGGGKTYLACNAIKMIWDKLNCDCPRMIIWLVPSDSILEQTIKNLSDQHHPYRQKLDMDFGGKVSVYTKDNLLYGQNFSPDTVKENISICIMTYHSLRIDRKKKESRKLFQENGYLLPFTYTYQEPNLLEDTPDTALIQILRQFMPIVIVDESHNAKSDLSIEMINNLNPSFVLDLTATPKENSNIISFVDARELKKEHMVKLPIIVFHRNDRTQVIENSIQLQMELETQARIEAENSGAYIRPIVLFQAQPQNQDDSETFEKIKQKLIESGIPEYQIAIKTSKINDLKNIDLSSSACEIRYIITVNALKEGWDCPFAYILASVSNKKSKVDVEQIIGRILRQPYAKELKNSLLNNAYVLTCSNQFHETLDTILEGLQSAGFSEKDYRIATDPDQQKDNQKEQMQLNPYEESDFEDINTSKIKNYLYNQDNTDMEFIKAAKDKIELCQKEFAKSEMQTSFEQGMNSIKSIVKVNSIFEDQITKLRIPQFYFTTPPTLFGNGKILLTPEHLSSEFQLSKISADIDFEANKDSSFKIDYFSNDEAPRYKKVNQDLHNFIEKQPDNIKLSTYKSILLQRIDKENRYGHKDVEDYINRIIQTIDQTRIDEFMSIQNDNANYIRIHILQEEKKYRFKKFKEWIDTGKIYCDEYYKLSNYITPLDTFSSIPNSLYVREKNNLNQFERKLLNEIVALDNIVWWHRIIERDDFKINGFINHYPDFMIMTKSGKLIMIEAKGDYLANEETILKLELGRLWQSCCAKFDNKYQYYMIFENKKLQNDGAYTLNEFINIFKNM